MARIETLLLLLLAVCSSTSHLLHNHANISHLYHGINSPLDPIVDANMSAMNKVYHTGNLCPFQRKILSKMSRGELIKIEILGGSETFGADLRRKEEERWSTRLNALLNNGWYNGSISVINRAIPACNVDAWIYQTTRFKDADLVIVDLSVNDQGFDPPVLTLYYETLVQLLDELPNHPALLFVQMFRTSLYSKKEVDSVCPDPERHGSAVRSAGTLWWCKRWWDMQDYVTAALHKFNVPYVSYRDLVWPVYFSPPERLADLWDGTSHPGCKVHALNAKLIASAIMRLVVQTHSQDAKKCKVERNSRYVSESNVDNTVVGLCNAPLTRMFSNDSAASREHFSVYPENRPVEYPSMWRYYNDSKQKYGWILEESPERFTNSCVVLGKTDAAHDPCYNVRERTTISFSMDFGPSPILQVTYLKSWSEEMGSAVLWLDGNTTFSVNLPGYWKDEYSVSHYSTITPTKPANISAIVLGENFLLPSLTPGKHIVHIAAASLVDHVYFTHGTTLLQTKKNKRYKWKLLGLTSC